MVGLVTALSLMLKKVKRGTQDKAFRGASPRSQHIEVVISGRGHGPISGTIAASSGLAISEYANRYLASALRGAVVVPSSGIYSLYYSQVLGTT